MKKMLSFFACAILVGSLSTKTFAHSHLTDSSPQDGEVMSEAVQDIVINFDGKIMKGSFIEVTSTEGVSFEVDTIEIGEGQLIATLAEPLSNGEYKVNWSIISADGHPLEGKYSFTVNAPQITETPVETNDSKEGQVEEQENETGTSEKSDIASDEDSNMLMYIVIGLAVIILVVGGLLLFRRKK